jgi:uncharacterized membrane protein YwaF
MFNFFEIGLYNNLHLSIIVLAVLIPFLLRFLYQKKPNLVNRLQPLLVSLLLISFCFDQISSVLAGYNFRGMLPLHICVINALLIPFCYVYRVSVIVQKIQYYPIFVGIFTAFIALIIPQKTSGSLFDPTVFTFYFSHMVIVACGTIFALNKGSKILEDLGLNLVFCWLSIIFLALFVAIPVNNLLGSNYLFVGYIEQNAIANFFPLSIWPYRLVLGGYIGIIILIEYLLTICYFWFKNKQKKVFA